VGGVRHAEPVLQELELLVRLVQPRRELDRVQQAPEVIARIRKMRLSRS